jgi:hypothetical protein
MQGTRERECAPRRYQTLDCGVVCQVEEYGGVHQRARLLEAPLEEGGFVVLIPIARIPQRSLLLALICSLLAICVASKVVRKTEPENMGSFCPLTSVSMRLSPNAGLLNCVG